MFGKPLTINVSNKAVVKSPKPGTEEASENCNKDYTNSEYHRFKIVGSKNYQNISPPSTTLHISNIPTPDASKIKELFSRFGTVVNFKFFAYKFMIFFNLI